MNKSIENKLLHFFTSGNIYEDFAEARAKKTARLRRLIRACFYVHCAAAALSIALAAVLHAGAGLVAVVLCEVLLAGLAFMSAGEMTLLKTLLYCADILFAAAMFVTGALGEIKAPFFAVGGISAVAAVFALAAFFAANSKAFLENFSPLDLRREHYTLMPSFSPNPLEMDPGSPEKPVLTLTPEKTEMQKLADSLKEILCKPQQDDILAETTKPAKEPIPEGPQTEVTQ